MYLQWSEPIAHSLHIEPFTLPFSWIPWARWSSNNYYSHHMTLKRRVIKRRFRKSAIQAHNNRLKVKFNFPMHICGSVLGKRKSWKVRMDSSQDPTAGFIQGWLLSVLFTSGALSSPVFIDTAVQHWLLAIDRDCMAVGCLSLHSWIQFIKVNYQY